MPFLLSQSTEGFSTTSSEVGSGAIAWGWDGQLFYPTDSLRGGSGYFLYWPGD